MRMPSQGAAEARIKFENPPINELAIALYFLPLVELKAQHIGLYWDRIRAKYPFCEQQLPIVNSQGSQPPSALLEVPGEIFPLPRFWFSSESHPTLIQIQRNAFLLNWRRGPAGDYPHYEYVSEEFWKEFEAYKRFIQDPVGGNLDVIERCELTYVNLITPNEVFTAPAQLRNMLPLLASLSDVETDGRTLAGMNATVAYRVDSTLLIDVAVRLGKRADNQELVAVLELKAHGTPGDLSLEGARAWYDSAHGAIYQLFLDVTAKHVQQQIWRPRA